jgi:hypothetical protein
MNDDSSNYMDFFLVELTPLNNKSEGPHSHVCNQADIRAYGQYESYHTDILKNAFLLSLYDQNQVYNFTIQC